MTQPAITVKVKVELFGVPRLKAGVREIETALPQQPGRPCIVRKLAQAYPLLIGKVLREDLTGLQDGYVFNLNGLAFIQDDEFILNNGDSLLLLSNQAGG